MKRLLLSIGTIALCGALALPAAAQQAPGTREINKDKPAATHKAKSKNHGRVYLGVYTVPVEDLSSRMKKRFNLKEDEGVIVLEVMPDSPADEAGLQHGDVITHVDGKAITDEDELRADLRKAGVGHQVKLSVCREGKKKEITAKLGTAPDREEMTSAPSDWRGDEEDRPPSRANGSSTEQRIEQLERKISRLEKRLNELQEKLRPIQRGP